MIVEVKEEYYTGDVVEEFIDEYVENPRAALHEFLMTMRFYEDVRFCNPEERYEMFMECIKAACEINLDYLKSNLHVVFFADPIFIAPIMAIDELYEAADKIVKTAEYGIDSFALDDDGFVLMLDSSLT